MGTRRVRALLESDRRAAHEVRAEVDDVRLETIDYKAPLRVRLKRSFREDDRVRLGSMLVSAGALLLLLGCLASVLTTARATARVNHDEQNVVLVASAEALRERAAVPVVDYRPTATTEPVVAGPVLPIRERLQHARRVLRIGGDAEAAMARTLLEELARDRPRDGRAYATLAEACLRLSDATCARDAVTKAMARQPRRAKYRALAERIERAFASAGE